MESVIAGTQRHLLDLALGLDPERFEQLLVVSLERDPDFAAWIPKLQNAGVAVVELPMRRRISPLDDRRALHKLREIVESRQPSLVHGHSAKAGYLARLVARTLGLPAVYTPHVLPFRKYDSRLKRWFYVGLERFAMRSADFLIAVSESERQEALAARLLPPERIALIPNGIDAAQFCHAERRPAVRAQLGVDDAMVLIGAVGNLRPQKDYETFVHAAAIVAANLPARFLIAGDGPLRDKLAAQTRELGIEDMFIILGWHDDIAGLLAALDIYVICSRYEGCPYALLEAMASGTPVVGTAVPGIEEIIVAGRYGRLTPAGDAKALAETIEQAVADREGSLRMAAAARQLAERSYSRQTMLSRTAEVYERCAAGL
jgi:glycosyltransferase involved in cell wall biosynthesis